MSGYPFGPVIRQMVIAMLILTRRPGESIRIFIPGTDKQTEFTVLGLKGNQVRTGTYAPKDFSILRDELVGRFVELE